MRCSVSASGKDWPLPGAMPALASVRLVRKNRSTHSRTGSSTGSFFLASLPLTDLIEMMRPEAPAEVLHASHALRYREHIGVHLLVQGSPFPDNWIYVHSPKWRPPASPITAISRPLWPPAPIIVR